MKGEKLVGEGGSNEWEGLRGVEAPVVAEVMKTEQETAQEVGRKVLAVADVVPETSRAEVESQDVSREEAEKQEVMENPRLELMRQKWGDFESSRELFGEKTEMVPYEYWIIAENMPWDKFTEFCDGAAELGKKSEQEYQKMMFDKASELCGKGMCLPRSFEIAVRRYNTLKQFGEKRPDKFYYATNLGRAASEVAADRSGIIEEDYEAEDQGDGKNPRRMHLKFDEDGESGLNAEAMMTVVLDGSVIDDDEFDPVGGEPAMNRVTKEKILAVIGRDEMITDMFRLARHRDSGSEGDYQVMSVQQWQNGGAPVETEQEQSRRRHRLATETIFRPDKKEARKFVDGFLEKVDDEELKKLIDIYRQDAERGMEAAIEYYAGVFGVEPPRMVWSEEEKRGEARRKAITGTLQFSVKDKKSKPEKMLAMAGHEMFHEYQHVLENEWAAGRLEPGTLKEKQARLLYYNTNHHDDGLFYASQLDEVQAYHFGDTLRKRLKKLKR